jgi:hypothetical protein
MCMHCVRAFDRLLQGKGCVTVFRSNTPSILCGLGHGFYEGVRPCRNSGATACDTYIVSCKCWLPHP